MYREKNKATCRRFIQQIFNEGDLSSIRDFLSSDSIHHELDSEVIPAGRSPEWYAGLVDLYRLAFPDLRVEIQEQVAESDRVVTCLRMRGTQTGPLMGIGVSGKAVDFTGIRVDRLAEGKIAESWFHWDGLGMLQQIGALPELARNPLAAPWMNEAITVTEIPRPSFVQVQAA
jgi:predicted ester cyclase